MTWTDCDEAEGYVVPNVLSPRDLVFRPDFMDETVTSSTSVAALHVCILWLHSRFVSAMVETRRQIFS